MVVIEPVVSPKAEEEKMEKITPEVKRPAKDEFTASSSSSTAVDGAAGYASDGFETASEADLTEDEIVGEESERVIEDTTEAEKRTAEQGESQEERQVELNQEEIDEKALADANNAKVEGNNLFKDGHYKEALLKYDIALQGVKSIPSSSELCSVCHANRAACYSKMGKFEDSVKECTKALELNSKYLKVLLRRAEAQERLEHFDEAISDMTKVLEIDPGNDQARRTIVRLKPLADEKREKMKEEMIGKLKEMGNSILGRFGMSVDNFNAVKDPNTGSYSISFQR